ncbi:hypothetical protein VNO77_46896 [Canavalia gladiata]|uniref:Uncharacterized protein n=1 Tax=Canavalia gladiata TaxID=3824 RepID=A0AAN9JET2_CANGL
MVLNEVGEAYLPSSAMFAREGVIVGAQPVAGGLILPYNPWLTSIRSTSLSALWLPSVPFSMQTFDLTVFPLKFPWFFKARRIRSPQDQERRYFISSKPLESPRVIVYLLVEARTKAIANSPPQSGPIILFNVMLGLAKATEKRSRYYWKESPQKELATLLSFTTYLFEQPLDIKPAHRAGDKGMDRLEGPRRTGTHLRY